MSIFSLHLWQCSWEVLLFSVGQIKKYPPPKIFYVVNIPHLPAKIYIPYLTAEIYIPPIGKIRVPGYGEYGFFSK